MIDLYCRGGQTKLPGFPDFLSALLSGRGIRTPEEAKVFLEAEKQPLCDPFDMPGMREAAEFLISARDMKTRAVIYGDYDCDGVCASAIMLHTLRALEIPAEVMLPDRHGDGYGLNMKVVEEIAARASLLITVDNGITAVEEVRHARELGLRVIVTDHHRRHEELPPADVIVCPSLGGYPCEYLCGAGVAFQVSRAMLGERAMQLLDLCALATIADMVPLRGENRTLASLGLKAIASTARPGLRALMSVANMKKTSRITAKDAGFTLAPRINACGRMESAYTALRLLLAENEAEAARLAVQTQDLNDRRKEEEDRMLASAREKLKKTDLVSLRAIVLWDESWDSGVCGLTAGRIAEETGYPTVIMSVSDGEMVGSARAGSSGKVDIHAAIAACGELLVRFGGHKKAAGLTLKAENAEKFRQRLSDAVSEQTGGCALQVCREYDAEIALSDITLENIALLDQLEPFGQENPEPAFLLRDVKVNTAAAIGVDAKHLKGVFSRDGAERTGMAFSMGSRLSTLSNRVDLLVCPHANTFNGITTPEMMISEIMNTLSSVPEDPVRESYAAVCDLERILDSGMCPEPEKPESGLPEQAFSEPQGVCVVCRRAASVKDAAEAFPQFDRFFYSAADPRAYNGILYAADSARVSKAYRRVILWDGEMLPGEKQLWEKTLSCPVHVMDRKGAAGLLPGLRIGKDELRDVYRAARRGEASVRAVAAAAGITESAAVCGLNILSRLGLIKWTTEPFWVSVLSSGHCVPEEDRLFRFVNGLK